MGRKWRTKEEIVLVFVLMLWVWPSMHGARCIDRRAVAGTRCCRFEPCCGHGLIRLVAKEKSKLQCHACNLNSWTARRQSQSRVKSIFYLVYRSHVPRLISTSNVHMYVVPKLSRLKGKYKYSRKQCVSTTRYIRNCPKPRCGACLMHNSRYQRSRS